MTTGIERKLPGGCILTRLLPAPPHLLAWRCNSYRRLQKGSPGGTAGLAWARLPQGCSPICPPSVESGTGDAALMAPRVTSWVRRTVNYR